MADQQPAPAEGGGEHETVSLARITRNDCGTELPPHTREEHLDTADHVTREQEPHEQQHAVREPNTWLYRQAVKADKSDGETLNVSYTLSFRPTAQENEQITRLWRFNGLEAKTGCRLLPGDPDSEFHYVVSGCTPENISVVSTAMGLFLEKACHPIFFEAPELNVRRFVYEGNVEALEKALAAAEAQNMTLHHGAALHLETIAFWLATKSSKGARHVPKEVRVECLNQVISFTRKTKLKKYAKSRGKVIAPSGTGKGTLLHRAVYHRLLTTTKLLLSLDFSLLKSNDRGETPLDLAEQKFGNAPFGSEERRIVELCRRMAKVEALKTIAASRNKDEQ
eukprot:INCI3651.1.p1 GENE.INCI3651.1~~INCI3651.1.p1  ORF type:complete len:358 (+),score=46.51 INCI3651.1:62-1075(+)